MFDTKTKMKSIKTLTGAVVFSGILAVSTLALAADTASSDAAKNAKPYPLKTCIVSDEKLEGDMGDPYVFVYQGQQIKLCCKNCLPDFEKDPAKYLKKLADAQPAEKKDASTTPGKADTGKKP
jgi:hypothetical protein